MATKTQIINGNFQDEAGNPLANGYLLFEITNDEQVTSPIGQVCSGVKIKVNLDVTGNVPALPVVSLWPNSALLPANSQYMVRGYTQNGQLVWGPNYVTIPATSPYDLGNIIPAYINNNIVLGGLTLQTNGVQNGNQNLLNLKNGTNVTITDNGTGGVTIAASVPAPPPQVTLETNGTLNGSQTLLNLKNGTNVTVVDDGVGGVTINSSAGGTGGVVPNLWLFGGDGLAGLSYSSGIAQPLATQVNGCLTRVWQPITISKASLTIGGASSPPCNAAVGIYDSTGARVFYSGDNAFVQNSGGPQSFTVTVTPVTLQAGDYWVFVATSQLLAITPSVSQPDPCVNKASTKMGYFTVAGATGTLPASITIGSIVADNTHGCPSCLFE